MIPADTVRSKAQRRTGKPHRDDGAVARYNVRVPLPFSFSLYISLRRCLSLYLSIYPSLSINSPFSLHPPLGQSSRQSSNRPLNRAICRWNYSCPFLFLAGEIPTNFSPVHVTQQRNFGPKADCLEGPIHIGPGLVGGGCSPNRGRGLSRQEMTLS